MEENQNKEEVNEVKEEMTQEEKMKKQITELYKRCIFLENQLKGIDVATLRLNFLFKILDHGKMFPMDFVTKVIDEIVANMTIEEDKSEEKSDNSNENK